MPDPFASWSDLERRAYLFSYVYEQVRKEYQPGFRVWSRPDDPETRSSPKFKAFCTVVRWLEKQGWRVTWNERRWQDYIAFTFKHLSPTVPMPGQLRNQMILRSFISSAPEYQPLTRSPQDLESVYQKVLRPELRDAKVMASMGLRVSVNPRRITEPIEEPSAPA